MAKIRFKGLIEQCSRCGSLKRNGRCYLKNTICRACYAKDWRQANPESSKNSDRKRYSSDRNRQWRYNNPEAARKLARRAYQRNKQAYFAANARRRAAKLQRTPDWSDLTRIREIYQNCPPGYHVDHIVPLRGKNVSGLHVSWNLQYLTPQENNRKNNKYGND